MSLTVSKFNRKAKRRRGNGQRDEMKRVGGDGETSERRNEKSWRRRENVVNHAFTVAVRSDVANRLQEA